jgi:hypothetical protein
MSALRQQADEVARADGVRTAAADREASRRYPPRPARGRASAEDFLAAAAELEAEGNR